MQKQMMIFIKTKVAFYFLYQHIGQYKPFNSKGRENKAEKEDVLIDNISLNKLNFAFPGSLHVFSDLKVSASLGELTVVYGKSGSGKSVLVSVLGRLIPVTSGDVLVNEKNWNTYTDIQWRENVSFIMQPAHIFSTTVLQNIGWGQNISNPEAFVSFCKEKGFDRFFEAFPDSYITQTNKLSASQKQLLAVAAALYRKPKVLVLDEPFALMDDEMEEFCWQLIRNLKSRILIIFLRRINLLQKGQNILFLFEIKLII